MNQPGHNYFPEGIKPFVYYPAFVVIVLLLAMLLLSGCSTGQSSSGVSSFSPVQKTGQIVIDSIREVTETLIPGSSVVVDGVNVGSYNVYRLQDYLAVHRAYRAQSPDWHTGWLCLQFAQGYQLAVGWVAAHQGYADAPPAIAVLTTGIAYPWGGIPGDEGRHALNIFVAREEINEPYEVYVIEPQAPPHYPGEYYVRVAWQDEAGRWVFDPRAYPNWPYIENAFPEL